MYFHLRRDIAAWKKEDTPPHCVEPIKVQVICCLSFIAHNVPTHFHFLQMFADIIITAF